jgi:hypothetical protein
MWAGARAACAYLYLCLHYTAMYYYCVRCPCTIDAAFLPACLPACWLHFLLNILIPLPAHHSTATTADMGLDCSLRTISAQWGCLQMGYPTTRRHGGTVGWIMAAAPPPQASWTAPHRLSSLGGGWGVANVVLALRWRMCCSCWQAHSTIHRTVLCLIWLADIQPSLRSAIAFTPPGYNHKYGFGFSVALGAATGVNCSFADVQVNGNAWQDIACPIYDAVLQAASGGSAGRLNCSWTADNGVDYGFGAGVKGTTGTEMAMAGKGRWRRSRRGQSSSSSSSRAALDVKCNYTMPHFAMGDDLKP